MKFFILLVVFACLAVISTALPQRYQGKYLYNGLSLADHAQFGVMSSGSDTDTTEVFTILQQLDHFDRSNNVTFEQRYFVDERYWSGKPDAPVFLCVGGEGPPFSKKVLSDSDHCNDMVELAPKVGALMLALEHRYYGPSTPFDDYSNEHLKFHNTEQALSDLAHFVASYKEEKGLKSTNKWISFGGSYPGMMAALSRYRYPHLIHAAVSSSAPLQASLEMAYNDVVSHALSAEIVGGSEQCLNIVIEGHQQIGELLKTQSGRETLATKFNVCNAKSLENPANREVFAGNGVIYVPAQGNDPSCTTDNCDISRICKTLLTTEGESIDRLASLAAAQHGGTCMATNAAMINEAIKNPKNPERSWLYQTCTEWGFYQTCNEGSKCPYTQGLHTVDVDLELCEYAFDISPETVKANIDNANAMYGGIDIQGSRILFVNGEVDPWNANSVIYSPNAAEPTLWVDGASHHFWTHTSKPTDQPEVVAARNIIWDQVIAWLAEA